jgi:hypothetical protein
MTLKWRYMLRTASSHRAVQLAVMPSAASCSKHTWVMGRMAYALHMLNKNSSSHQDMFSKLLCNQSSAIPKL